MESQLSQISFHLLTAEPVAGDVPAVDGAPESATNPPGCSEASYAFAAGSQLSPVTSLQNNRFMLNFIYI